MIFFDMLKKWPSVLCPNWRAHLTSGWSRLLFLGLARWVRRKGSDSCRTVINRKCLSPFSFPFPLAVLKHCKIHFYSLIQEIQDLQLGEYEILSVWQTFIKNQAYLCTILGSEYMRLTKHTWSWSLESCEIQKISKKNNKMSKYNEGNGFQL